MAFCVFTILSILHFPSKWSSICPIKDTWRYIMDIQSIMKIFDDTAYVRMGGRPEE